MNTNMSNGNQYYDNSNSLLVILLLFLLLKCDKTKQKYEAISSALQEKHTFNENIETITNNFETTPSTLREERIKSHIEKAKMKMLIKELKANTEPSIYLKEVKEQSLVHLEEKPEELHKRKLQELNIEKSEELNNEKPEEVNIEKPEELGNEKPEELHKEKPEELENIKSEELHDEKSEEFNIEKLKELEELENKSLKASDKKNLVKVKSSVKNSRGDAIRPMEIILKQLVGENIVFSTAAQSNRFVANATLLSVKDGIVHLDTSHSILSIPICEIVGVESNLINAIELLPLVETSMEELTEYEDCSLKNLFSTMIGEQISIETTGSGSFNNIKDKIVTNVGSGIVVLDNTIAISLSKIILVERR